MLVDTYIQVRDGVVPRKEAVSQLSKLLREYGASRGIEIDEIYRNENGISMQLAKIDYLFRGETGGLNNTSTLFRETVTLYRNDKPKFEELLSEAKSVVNSLDLAKEKELSEEANKKQALAVKQYDFETEPSLVNTKPFSLKYFQDSTVYEDTWEVLFLEFLRLIFEDYRKILENIRRSDKPNAPLVTNHMRAMTMRRPVEFVNRHYVEMNRSADELMHEAKRILEACNVDYDNVVIMYRAQATTQAIAKENKKLEEQLYKKLYAISRIYYNPEGTSLEKIKSILGTEYDEPVVVKILDDATWAKKISDGLYMFPTSLESSQASVVKETEATYTTERRNGVVTPATFTMYMRDKCGLAEGTCRSYVSAIRSAEEYAKTHGYVRHSLYNVDVAEALQLIDELAKSRDFAKCNSRTYNFYWATFKKFSEMVGAEFNLPKIHIEKPKKDEKSWRDSFRPTQMTMPEVAQNEEEAEACVEFDKERYIDVLMQRYRSGMTFDSIDFDIFREIYKDVYGSDIEVDDNELEKQLRKCGVFYNGRLFPAEAVIDNTTKDKLLSYISNSFSSGKKVLYYKAIFEDMSDDFDSCYALADEKMLGEFIKYTCTGKRYFFFKDYMALEADAKLDAVSEIEQYMLAAGKPVRIDEVCAALSHIPKKKVERIIRQDERFRWNSEGEYFHKDIFEITEEEKERIATIIDKYIEANDYAIWAEVWKEIGLRMPSFVENNLYLSTYGVRNALAGHYLREFNFSDNIISRLGYCYDTREIFQLYAMHHQTFTSEDIEGLAKELNTLINFGVLSEVSVRVSHDLFVSKGLMNFDVEATDNAIANYMIGDYVRLREIDSYLLFPNVGYEWNEYLLESYLVSYSKRFQVINNGRSLNNVPGFITKRGETVKTFLDACADYLANSGIELKKTEALNFLVDQNVISRRSYKNIDEALQRAKKIRNGKGL